MTITHGVLLLSGDESGPLILGGDEPGDLILWGDEATEIDDTPSIVFDTHDGSGSGAAGRKDRAPERAREHRERQAALRESVARAFRQAYGEPEPAATTETTEGAAIAHAKAPSVRQMARVILPVIDAPGIQASLSEIEALLREFQAGRVQMRDDDDAITVLLLLA